MQDDVSEEIKKAVALDRYHRDSCLRKLCLLALAATIVITVLLGVKVPNQDFGSARYIGTVVGHFIGLFIIPALFFAIIRLARNASVPTRGLGTGVAILLFLSISMTYSSLKDLEVEFGAAPVQDAGITQR
jgi:hypothetical protein